MKTLLKILIVLFLTFIGFATTCGGTILVFGSIYGIFTGFKADGGSSIIGLIVTAPIAIIGATIVLYRSIQLAKSKQNLKDILLNPTFIKTIKIIGIMIILGIIIILVVNNIQPYIVKKQMENISLISLSCIFLILIYFFFFIKRTKYTDSHITIPSFPVQSTETIDLMNSLTKANISNISSIEFIPKNGESFYLKTENMKRIGVYVTTTLNKSEFSPEELRGAFEYITKYITLGVTQDEFENIKDKMEKFVRSGGEVKIEKNNP